MVESINSDPPLDSILRHGNVGHASWQCLLGVVVDISPVLGVAIALLELHPYVVSLDVALSAFLGCYLVGVRWQLTGYDMVCWLVYVY